MVGSERESECAGMVAELRGRLRHAAFGLLSRREYSRYELEQKLGQVAAKWQLSVAKSASSYQDDEESGAEVGVEFQLMVIAALLDDFQQRDYQSDQRFAESLLRSRIARGQGVSRITQELRHKGVSDELRTEVLEAAQVDWFELASELWQRRFGPQPPADYAQRAKQQRFLLYRGFTYDQCIYAFEVEVEKK
ncbi:MAG: regulatory protein RecX [Motiliproteus sp.]